MNAKVLSILLLFCLSVSSCNRNGDSYAINGKNGIALSDIIAFSGISNPVLSADSMSVTTMTVRLSPQSDSANRYVIFRTSLGAFPNNNNTDTIFANSDGIAIVTLYGSIPGIAIIAASVGTVSIDTIIQFIPALPTDMLLSADKYIIDSSSDSIHFSAQLVREIGRVSDKQPVYFTTSRTDGSTDSLIIPDFSESKNGFAYATLQDPFNSRGYFKITAVTIAQSGDTLRKSLTINIR